LKHPPRGKVKGLEKVGKKRNGRKKNRGKVKRKKKNKKSQAKKVKRRKNTGKKTAHRQDKTLQKEEASNPVGKNKRISGTTATVKARLHD